MAHSFNRDDGTFALVDFGDLAGSISSSSVVTSIGSLVGAVSLSGGLTTSGNAVTTSTGIGVSVSSGQLITTGIGFFAHKNGGGTQSVGDSAYEQLTFPTEKFDQGGYFSSSKWTPPAGIVFLQAHALISSGAASNIFNHTIKITYSAMANDVAAGLSLYANGGAAATQVSCIDRTDGTRTYQVNLYTTTNTGGKSIVDDNPAHTYFSGSWLGT